MDIRKIAVAAGFACGAALAFGPVAAADPSDFAIGTLNAEINSQNSLFDVYAALSGVSSSDIVHGTAGTATTVSTYDQILPSALTDVAPKLLPGVDTFGEVKPLETFLYGTNPIVAGISGNSGPYNEYNGALTQFYDAYNVYAYAAANNGALDTNAADYIGSASSIQHALDTGTLAGAAQYFYNFGLGDLKGYEADFVPGAQSTGDIHPMIASEIGQLNTLFEQYGQLTGDYKDIIPNIDSSQGTYINFDTISPDTASKAFEQLVFGLNPANVSGDPGSYDVFNGASVEFFNALNVGDYALMNGGSLMPTDLIFGTHDFLGDGVTAAIGEYLNLGFQDLAGYFLPAAATSIIP